MRKFRSMLALSAGLMLAALAPTWSGAARAETPDEIRAGYVDDIATAHELAAFAAKYKSPEAYLAAAGLLLKVDALTKGKLGEPPAEVTIVGADKKETKEAVKGSTSLKAQAKVWLADAEGLGVDAKLAKEVKALAAAVEKRDYTDPEDKDVGLRGKAGGPANVTRTIAPGDTHVFHWKFKGDEWAAVGMTTGSNLRITIVGPNGGTLFALGGSRANYRWMPKKSDSYIIRIHNGTNRPTTYNLASN